MQSNSVDKRDTTVERRIPKLRTMVYMIRLVYTGYLGLIYNIHVVSKGVCRSLHPCDSEFDSVNWNMFSLFLTRSVVPRRPDSCRFLEVNKNLGGDTSIYSRQSKSLSVYTFADFLGPPVLPKAMHIQIVSKPNSLYKCEYYSERHSSHETGRMHVIEYGNN